MSQYSYGYRYEGEISEKSYRSFYVKTYAKMAFGLLITAVVAALGFYDLINNGVYGRGFMINLLSGPGSMLMLFAQLGIAIYFSARIMKMSKMTAKLCFILYSVLTGITFSTLPLMFSIPTIFMAFGFSALLFINLVIIGMTTKVDISKFSGIMMAGLLTVVIMSVIGMFVQSELFFSIYNYIGVFVFMGITAWDAQNLKRYYIASTQDTRMISSFATYAAFGLYLDFINLFLYILQIFGRNSDN